MKTYEQILRENTIPFIERMSEGTHAQAMFERREGCYVTGANAQGLPQGDYEAYLVNTGELTMRKIQPSDGFTCSVFDSRVTDICTRLDALNQKKKQPATKKKAKNHF